MPSTKPAYGSFDSDGRELGVVGGGLGIEGDAAVGHRGDAAEVRGHDGEGGLAVLDRVFGLGELRGGGHGGEQGGETSRYHQPRHERSMHESSLLVDRVAGPHDSRAPVYKASPIRVRRSGKHQRAGGER